MTDDSAWRCSACASPDEQRYRYGDPTDPDQTCAYCGEPLPEIIRTRLAVERLRAASLAARRTAVPAEHQRPVVAAGILSARTAARRLGIGRDTLARLVQASEIVRIPTGTDRRWGYRARDVEALIERGFRLDGPEAPRPAPKRKRRRSKENGAAQVQRISDLPY